MKKRGKWESRPSTANNMFQCHVKIQFVTLTSSEKPISQRHILHGQAELRQGTGLGPHCLQALQLPHLSLAILQRNQALNSLVFSRLRLSSGVLSMSVCSCLSRYPWGKQQALEWVSLGTEKAGGRWFNEGGPSSMVCCMLALGSKAGLELKAQGSALLQSSPGKWVQPLPAKPCSSESPKIQGTAPSALHGASTAQVCPGGWILLGASPRAPEGTQRPPLDWSTPGDSTAQPKELHQWMSYHGLVPLSIRPSTVSQL